MMLLAVMSADAATAPIILYNVPGRTGCKISPDVVRRLSVHPNVMAIKEASGDIGYAMKVARYFCRIGEKTLIPPRAKRRQICRKRL